MSEQTAKADAPPPLGSTLTTMTPSRSRVGATERATKASTSAEAKALLELSAQKPIDSRSSIAGSSASIARTVSIFVDESQRGSRCWRCVHFSGWSVRAHSSQTSESVIVSKTGRPDAVVSSIIFE